MSVPVQRAEECFEELLLDLEDKDQEALDLGAEIAAQAARSAHDRAGRKARQAFHDWVQGALTKGAAKAHRYCKQQELLEPLQHEVDDGSRIITDPMKPWTSELIDGCRGGGGTST